MIRKSLRMRGAVWGLVVLGSAFGTANAAVTIRKATVQRVVDGDTVHVLDSKNQTLKIRMMGIDSAESHLPTDHGVVGQNPWGERATRSLQSILKKGDRVEVEDFGKDKYGRTLGYVVLSGLNANIEQARRGQAISYLICPAGGCTREELEDQHADEIVRSCHAAQVAGRGVFNPANPLREMPFEFRLRQQKRQPDKFVGSLMTRQYVKPERYRNIPVCDRVFFLSESDAKKSGFTPAFQKN